MSFGIAAVGAAISCRCHSVELPKISHEVSVRTQAYVFEYLLDCQKTRAQERRCAAESNFLQILAWSRSRFLFEEMAKARRREIDLHRERGKIPRGCWFGFYPGDDEFYSSIHCEEPETKRAA